MATKKATKKTATTLSKVAPKKQTRPYKFPKSTERSADKPAVLCPADRILKLYIQETGDNAKRISNTVRQWFTEEALKKDWSAVAFLPEVQSAHGAGCVLYKTVGENKDDEDLIKKLGGGT